jgi:hypothetical protein
VLNRKLESNIQVQHCFPEPTFDLWQVGNCNSMNLDWDIKYWNSILLTDHLQFINKSTVGGCVVFRSKVNSSTN